MQPEKPSRQDNRQAVAAARSQTDDGSLVTIAVLSLGGLACALFEIAHYVGTDALRQMLAL